MWGRGPFVLNKFQIEWSSVRPGAVSKVPNAVFNLVGKIRKMGNVTCWLGLGAQGPAGPAGRRDTDVLENSQALFSDIRIYTP